MGDEAFIAWMRYFVREESRILEHIYLCGYINGRPLFHQSEYRINDSMCDMMMHMCVLIIEIRRVEKY